MHGSVWLVTMPLPPPRPPVRAYPSRFPIFFFLGGLFLIPELLIYLKYVFYGYLFLIHTKAKWDVFTTFFTTFSRVYWEKDDGCHYLVKTWTIHLKMKTKKKNSLKKHLLRRTLHKNTESLDWIFVYLYAPKALYLLSYKLSLYIKVRLKKYFSPSFAKKYNPFEYAS